jgi:Preprotein translocase subunit SecA (ATPase, RNA helicase)
MTSPKHRRDAPGVIADIVHQFVPAGSIEEQWDVPELEEVLRNEWQLDLAIQEMINESNSISADEILEAVEAAADEAYESKVEQVGRESFSAFERSIMLQTLDRSWREHLAALDHLRQGIHLRGYAQKNPKQEYKREAFELFAAMLDAVKLEVTRVVMNVQIQSPEQLGTGCRAVRRARQPPRKRRVPSRRIRRSGSSSACRGGSGHRRHDRRGDEPWLVARRRVGRERGQRAEGRPQRPVPVRQRQEVQAVSR